MGKAWTDKNISPHEFRKCLSSDINFVIEFENMVYRKRKQKREEMEHEMKVMEMQKRLQSRW